MNLKEFRDGRGSRRKFVADRVGIDGSHLNAVEGGRVNLSEKLAVKLSQFYDVDINIIKTMYKEGKNEECRDIEKKIGRAHV